MRKREETAGFTLIELLIVVAIIAILAAIAAPNFLEAQARAKVSRAKPPLTKQCCARTTASRAMLTPAADIARSAYSIWPTLARCSNAAWSWRKEPLARTSACAICPSPRSALARAGARRDDARSRPQGNASRHSLARCVGNPPSDPHRQPSWLGKSSDRESFGHSASPAPRSRKASWRSNRMCPSKKRRVVKPPCFRASEKMIPPQRHCAAEPQPN